MSNDVVRDFLLNHSKSSRNGTFPANTPYVAKITNPICGDHVELRIDSNGEIINDVGFKATACAICSASASLLSQEIKGQDINSALRWAALFETTLIQNINHPWPLELKAFSCFEHLKVNPSRKMCALLPWVVLKSAFKKAGGPND